jgi:hypothetical protein
VGSSRGDGRLWRTPLTTILERLGTPGGSGSVSAPEWDPLHDLVWHFDAAIKRDPKLGSSEALIGTTGGETYVALLDDVPAGVGIELGHRGAESGGIRPKILLVDNAVLAANESLRKRKVAMTVKR